MLVHRVICSECRVALGSEIGFNVGEPIACPECNEEFVVKVGKNQRQTGNRPVKVVARVEEDVDELPVPSKAKSRPSVVIDDDEEDDLPRQPKAKSKPAVILDDDDAVEPRPKKRARVEADDDDDDEDLPIRKKMKGSNGKKKGKRRGDDDDEKKSYKNSPIRFVILGILLVILTVMAYFLYIKKSDEGGSGQRPFSSQPC